MTLVFVVLFGLIIGSFLGALTYRHKMGISILLGRSFCDSCGKEISWYDNIPIWSFLSLGGRSRCCKKQVSWRYPLIEFFTALVFGIYYLQVFNNPLLLIPHLVFFSILISVFVIDFENYIIPDEHSYTLTLLAFVIILISDGNIDIYNHFYSGFVISIVLLFLHFITKKGGMGLGDVKLALPIGVILGLPMSLIFLITSFVIGAVVGLLLIILSRKSFKSQIPFGPFLIISFFVVFFYSDVMRQLIIQIY